MTWDVSFISLHGDPLAPLGGPQHGGQNVYVKELSRYLGAFGLSVDVYSRRESKSQPEQETYSKNTRVIRIPVGPPETIPKEKILEILRDIAAWIPTYQIQQGLKYQLVHSHYYLSGAIGLHLKNTWGIPLVHTFHSLGIIREEALGDQDASPRARLEIEKRLCQNADRIIATNPQERDDLVELYHTDPFKITIIPCGVNLDLFTPLDQNTSKKEIAFSPDDFLITFVGRLEERKGIGTLLEAVHLADNPRIQVVIVGGPPSEKPFLSWSELTQPPFNDFMAQIEDYGIGKQVTFTGGKPQSELSKYYSAADITVVPSYYEPFGMTAIEAMACGSSVVASRVGGLQSSVKENLVGALFEPRNAGQLAEKIKLFFEQPAMNMEMKQNARPYVAEYYSWKTIAKSIGEVYRELIEEH